MNNHTNVRVSVYGTFTYADLKWFLITLPSDIHFVCSDKGKLNDIYLKTFAEDYNRTLFKTADVFAVSNIVYCFGEAPQRLKRKYTLAKFIEV